MLAECHGQSGVVRLFSPAFLLETNSSEFFPAHIRRSPPQYRTAPDSPENHRPRRRPDLASRLARWQQHALEMFLVKVFCGFSLAVLSISTALWTTLWKNRKTRPSPSITRKGLNGLPLALQARLNWEIAPTTGIDKQ